MSAITPILDIGGNDFNGETEDDDCNDNKLMITCAGPFRNSGEIIPALSSVKPTNSYITLPLCSIFTSYGIALFSNNVLISYRHNLEFYINRLI